MLTISSIVVRPRTPSYRMSQVCKYLTIYVDSVPHPTTTNFLLFNNSQRINCNRFMTMAPSPAGARSRHERVHQAHQHHYHVYHEPQRATGLSLDTSRDGSWIDYVFVVASLARLTFSKHYKIIDACRAATFTSRCSIDANAAT
jgi:hypothetical protein